MQIRDLLRFRQPGNSHSETRSPGWGQSYHSTAVTDIRRSDIWLGVEEYLDSVWRIVASYAWGSALAPLSTNDVGP